MVADIYAEHIKKGKRTIDDVPSLWKEEVREILLEEGRGDLVNGS